MKNLLVCQLCGLLTNGGQLAHIVSIGDHGPRNKPSLVSHGLIADDYNIAGESNALYLCPKCHIEIDTHPEIYTYTFLSRVF